MTGQQHPDWLDAITTRVEQSPSKNSDQSVNGALRPAAVLVLIIDSDDGPNIVLTRRTATLANYPGVLVFPGGASETSDDGPVTTALREAAEEAGIDPDNVHVIGSLPPLVVPVTGFVVTPIVGWCTQLDYSDAVNPDEVAAIIQVPLRDFAGTSGRVQRVPATSAARSGFSVDRTTVGEMTATVIDSLVGHRDEL